ncbi:MAG TPA: hypothetical protein PKO25_06095 [Spirochaetota bacterium]|jgi:hypothetical protein|nr:MAG: hypothetical protein BWY96_01626 [Spirochaetes bacterium ADurb.BinA120]HNU91424.1 hypothetical protein [Spirochaetota bacterium]HPI13739.1 hypothetical protein [Spirochaetota bacterium]HPO46275.1 hypothetical protein [Spirochaetota bacterium]
MIWPWLRGRLRARAYLPEHLPDYVRAVTGGGAGLVDGHLWYDRGDTLVLVGYPLDGNFDTARLADAVRRALLYHRPVYLSLIAPELPALPFELLDSGSDRYFRLDLAAHAVNQKTRNMISRSSRELRLAAVRRLGPEHRALIASFLERTGADGAMRRVYEAMHGYVERAGGPLVLEARDAAGRLEAFDVADIDRGEYAFYMFNVRSGGAGIPGASDLLLHELLKRARAAGARYVNLGLGVNSGIEFFKRKWGGLPFMRHEYGLYDAGGGPLIDRIYGR